MRAKPAPGVRPRFSVSQISSFPRSFAEDVRGYVEAGAEGFGVWELKLGDGPDDEALELLAGSGLGSTTAVPGVPSILPLPLLPGPEDPRERVESICASAHRLARFTPSAMMCLTGPAGERDADEARAIVVEGLRAIRDEAELAGIPFLLEPYQRLVRDEWSIACTLSEGAELIDEAGGGIGMLFDVWHLWNAPDLADEIARHGHLIGGVHVNDVREPTRGWTDRVLPGDGIAGVPAILAMLEVAGWDGYYDLEVFSDNGTFGAAYDDSLWDLSAFELARRGREAFEQCWDARPASAGLSPTTGGSTSVAHAAADE